MAAATAYCAELTIASKQVDSSLADFMEIAPLSSRDPLTFVPATSQVGVTSRKIVSDPATVRAEASHSLVSKVTGDAGEIFMKSFIRTEAHREAAQLAISYMSVSWFLVAGAILTYLFSLAFYPRLKTWMIKRATAAAADDSSDEEEEEESPISYKAAPKALLPSSVDARIAYEAQAYTAS